MVKLPNDSKDPSIISRIEALEKNIANIVAKGVASSTMQTNSSPAINRQATKSNVSATITQNNTNAALPTAPLTKAEPFKDWAKVLTSIKKLNAAIGGTLDGCNAFCDGKRVLIQIENPILLQMLKDNDTTRSTIKRAIQEVTGIAYGIGPYRPQVQKEDSDPLDNFINSLPNSGNISIK